MSTKIGTFVKLAMAIITGDDAEATALKIQRKADAALNAQIAVKNAHTLTLQEDVENAEDILNNARANNGQLITNNEMYISSLLTARNTLDMAKEYLVDHKADIDFLKAQMTLVNAE